MKFSAIVSLAFSLATVEVVIAAPQPQDFGITSMSAAMSELASEKLAGRVSQREKGMFAKGKYKSRSKAVAPCKNGKSAGIYSCKNVDMTAFLSHEDMGSASVCI
jgi:hypothetical protein